MADDFCSVPTTREGGTLIPAFHTTLWIWYALAFVMAMALKQFGFSLPVCLCCVIPAVVLDAVLTYKHLGER